MAKTGAHKIGTYIRLLCDNAIYLHVKAVVQAIGLCHATVVKSIYFCKKKKNHVPTGFKIPIHINEKYKIIVFILTNIREPTRDYTYGKRHLQVVCNLHLGTRFGKLSRRTRRSEIIAGEKYNIILTKIRCFTITGCEECDKKQKLFIRSVFFFEYIDWTAVLVVRYENGIIRTLLYLIAPVSSANHQ